jgi:transposase
MLLPAMVQDYIAPDSPVRVIDAFVASLDLHRLGFERARPAHTGRPGYDPAALLRLYVYGYLNNLRSSRRLERACVINLEVIWLVRRLSPDFKTIADFRRDNHAGISGVCKAFVHFCRDQGLFEAARVVIDGTKVQAAASRRRVMTAEAIAAETVALDRRIAAYLAGMDEADATETDDANSQRTAAALTALQARRTALVELAETMAAEARRLGVPGEPEARPMGYNTGPKPPSYNVQAAVDPQSHMIVHHEVTTEATDNRLLHPVARRAKAALGVAALTVIADKGYANGAHAAACEVDRITPVVPVPAVANTRGDFYGPEAFRYDPATDSLTCPAGRKLLRNGDNDRDEAHRYRAEDCRGCPLKANCTTAGRRFVYRSWHHAALQRMARRAADDPAVMRLRRCTVEHPFGTLKAYLGNRFLLRGTLKAATETALAVLGYNIKRAIGVLGCQTLVQRLA